MNSFISLSYEIQFYRNVTTNKFIASLAVSDLLIGIVVMPLSLHSKVGIAFRLPSNIYFF